MTAGLAASALAFIGFAGVDSFLPMSATAAAAGTMAASAASAAPDMDSIFDARSPGGRHYGWLVNSKTPRTGFDVGPPTERVLSSVRRRPAAPAAPGGSVPAIYAPVGGIVPPTTVGPAGGPVDDIVSDGTVPSAPVGGFLQSVPGIVGTLPGSGSGSSGTTPGTVVVPAVPEPSTWTMLLLGFFVIGMILRRSRIRLAHEAF